MIQNMLNDFFSSVIKSFVENLVAPFKGITLISIAQKSFDLIGGITIINFLLALSISAAMAVFIFKFIVKIMNTFVLNKGGDVETHFDEYVKSGLYTVIMIICSPMVITYGITLTFNLLADISDKVSAVYGTNTDLSLIFQVIVTFVIGGFSNILCLFIGIFILIYIIKTLIRIIRSAIEITIFKLLLPWFAISNLSSDRTNWNQNIKMIILTFTTIIMDIVMLYIFLGWANQSFGVIPNVMDFNFYLKSFFAVAFLLAIWNIPKILENAMINMSSGVGNLGTKVSNTMSTVLSKIK